MSVNSLYLNSDGSGCVAVVEGHSITVDVAWLLSWLRPTVEYLRTVFDTPDARGLCGSHEFMDEYDYSLQADVERAGEQLDSLRMAEQERVTIPLSDFTAWMILSQTCIEMGQHGTGERCLMSGQGEQKGGAERAADYSLKSAHRSRLNRGKQMTQTDCQRYG